jgi:hypothetical protein
MLADEMLGKELLKEVLETNYDPTSGLHAGAVNVDDVAGAGPQKAFGHLAAAGISGAENKNGGFGHVGK